MLPDPSPSPTQPPKSLGYLAGKECFAVQIGRGAVSAVLTNYGARLVTLHAPDVHGKRANIVAGFPTLQDYVHSPEQIGCMVGRVANRIAQGRFEIDGTRYQLSRNHGAHNLHGGPVGFDRAVWSIQRRDQNSVTFRLISADRDQGFPGTLTLDVTYGIREDHELELTYHATTDKPTLVNLTNHTFFNLAGIGTGTVHDQLLQVNAARYTATNSDLIPTGELAAVDTFTALDFRAPKRIGGALDLLPNGLDHNLVLDIDQRKPAAVLFDPVSRREITFYTTQPGMQLYSAGCFKGGQVTGNGGQYQDGCGICLEAQHFPDSPHHPHFPSIVLRPGEAYHHVNRWQIGVRG